MLGIGGSTAICYEYTINRRLEPFAGPGPGGADPAHAKGG